ncbi:sensor histidine kinase [Rubritalea tangerina]|uniref:histidine kinase n=1 Tax=Rubritalea tangerina TaxID=430798 RepID=A0ABW4Z764_9BACT
MRIWHSLRWQIQSWHSVLLALIVTGMLTAFYYYEREVKIQLLDKELWGPIHGVIPAFDFSGVRGEAGRRPEREGGYDGVRPGPREGRRGRPSEVDGFDELFGGPPRERGPGPRPRGPGYERGRGPQGGGPDRRPPSERNGGLPGDSFSEGAGRRGPPDPAGVLEKIESRGFYVVAFVNEELFYKSEFAPKHIPQPMIKRGPELAAEEERARWNLGNREVIQPTPRGAVIVGASADRVDADLVSFRNKLVLVGGLVILVGVTGGWWITHRALKPVQMMSHTAREISGGDLSRRIDVADTQNELSELAGVLNDSFEKLENSFQQQIRFTADASHEMRTPLAVILAKSELALARERSPEKYRETIQTCHDSANHMHALIESLLELSKVDSGQFKVQLEHGDICSLVRSCVALVRPLAEQKAIVIEESLGDEVMVQHDVQRMKQVLINLLSNAIKYNYRDGHVWVSLIEEEQDVVIEVKDTGPGISGEALPHVFDRFYKVDDSRSAEKGSTGLGLAITKAIVEAHGGSITVRSPQQEGATFRVRIPSGKD